MCGEETKRGATLVFSRHPKTSEAQGDKDAHLFIDINPQVASLESSGCKL